MVQNRNACSGPPLRLSLPSPLGRRRPPLSDSSSSSSSSPAHDRSAIMISGGLLRVHPSELKFPYELRRQTSCVLQLTNKTEEHVAFKVKTTSPRKYSVRPNAGVIPPRSTCIIKLTMQAPKESPIDLHCKDKFLIQGVFVDAGLMAKDITPELFNKAPDKVVEEFKLRVVYVPANPPSPVPEDSDEGPSPRSSSLENEAQESAIMDAVSKSLEEESSGKLPEASTMIVKLTDEKNYAIQQNEKLRQELEDLRKKGSRSAHDYSIIFVIIMALLGIIFGYIINSS